MDYLTTDEAAKYLHISSATLRWLRHSGTGPKSFKIGCRLLWDRAELDAYIARQKMSTER